MLCNFVNREYLSNNIVFIPYNLSKIDMPNYIMKKLCK